MNPTIFITGCSSGIGRATVKYFHERGWNVVATLRTDPTKDPELDALDNVLVVRLDVTQEETIEKGVQQAIDRFGKIDALLNNAGYGIYGILEATPVADIRKEFDVNVIGTILMIKHVLPYMRKAGKGIIINISSMGGKITFPLGSLYHGTKFAIEGMSEALSFELKSIGIKVKLVEPGVIDTNFYATVNKGFHVDPEQKEYTPFVNEVMKQMQNAGSQSSEPIVVAEKIYQAATDSTDQMRYVAGADAEQLIKARKQLDDADYMAMLYKNFGLDPNK